MKNRLVINADLGSTTINRNIYGHFAEHLGRCIYEGIWVGEDSPIPNTDGIRNDVLEASKRLGFLFSDGQEVVLQTNIIGKME